MNQNEDEVDRYVQGIETQQRENLNAFMSRAKESLGQDSFDFINPEVISIKGNPVVAIPEYANEIDAELVVIGTATSTNDFNLKHMDSPHSKFIINFIMAHSLAIVAV